VGSDPRTRIAVGEFGASIGDLTFGGDVTLTFSPSNDLTCTTFPGSGDTVRSRSMSPTSPGSLGENTCTGSGDVLGDSTPVRTRKDGRLFALSSLSATGSRLAPGNDSTAPLLPPTPPPPSLH
jgi:hypothetical protein